MIELSRYFPNWHPEKFHKRAHDPDVWAQLSKNERMSALTEMQGLLHLMTGGSVDDLRVDRTKIGIGRFDENGNKVIVRWLS